MLGQSLREETLKLICYFFDCGIWAIKQALSVGMFYYLKKLIDVAITNYKNKDLDQNMIKYALFLWSKLLIFSPKYKIDFTFFKIYPFFMFILNNNQNYNTKQDIDYIQIGTDYKIIVIYILTFILRDVELKNVFLSQKIIYNRILL